MAVYVGIDVYKRFCQAVLMDDHGDISRNEPYHGENMQLRMQEHERLKNSQYSLNAPQESHQRQAHAD